MIDPTPPPRRPYRKPKLARHGSLTELTRVTGGTIGENDMVKSMNKTGIP